MRILFVCNTLYQIIVAACIKQMFPDSETDVILSDHSTANKKVYKNIQRTKLIFTRAYYVKTKYLYEYDNSITRNKKYHLLKSNETVLSMVKLNDKYDMFFCANSEPFTERVVNYVKNTNSEASINWFEDGLSAYNYDRYYFPTGKDRVKNYIKKFLFGVYRLTTCVDNFYVFQPNKMEWKPKAKIIQISAINSELIKNLGRLFDVFNCVDKYEEKYIFFEDGFVDWRDNTNLELLEIVSNVVGKENIIVKIHPRNPNNKFDKCGFKTNKDMSIPWEIIASNIDIEDKVLITMYSQSVITPEILLKRKGKVLILGNINKKNNYINHKAFDYMEKYYFEKDKDTYHVPSSIDEMKEMIKNIKIISEL